MNALAFILMTKNIRLCKSMTVTSYQTSTTLLKGINVSYAKERVISSRIKLMTYTKERRRGVVKNQGYDQETSLY